jgi:hypothetical protein
MDMTPTSGSTLTGGYRELPCPDDDPRWTDRPPGVRRGRYRSLRSVALTLVPALVLAATARADSATLDDLMQEIRALRQQVGEQQRQIEALEREHASPSETSVAVPGVEASDRAVAASGPTPEPRHFPQAELPGMPAEEAVVAAGEESPERGPKFNAGWDGKFYLSDAEDRFRLNLWAYTQFRYTLNHRENPPPSEPHNEYGFLIPRTRIFMEGRFADRFDFQLRTNIDSSGDFDLINAWVQVGLPKGWSLRAGELFPAISREDWMYPRDLLTTEFSANNATYAIGTAMGIQAARELAHHRYWFAFTNGAMGGKSESLDTDAADWAVSGRYEYQLGGEDWSIWDDLIGRRGRPTGALFGIAGIVQGRGNSDHPDTAPKFGTTLTADLSLNGDGYQTMAAFTWQHVDPDASTTSYNNYGFHLQGGYFVTRTLQLYGYYDGVYPGDQPGDLDPYHVTGAGLSFIPFDWTNLYKASLEAGYLFGDLSKTIVSPSSALGYLASSGSGQFLLRAQLQFGF